MTTTAPQARRWVTDKYLAEYFQVSRITIWAWAKNGRLPRPKKLGPNTTRWDFNKIVQAENAL